MNRRDFFHFSLAASALALLPGCASLSPSSARSRHPHPKRGLGMSTKNPQWAQRLAAINVAWFYSWGPQKPEGVPPGTEFIPMVYRKTDDTKFAEITRVLKTQKSTHLLGLNEPDEKKQGNMTVDEALALWPLLMALGLPLGSPGCVHPDNAWMKAFMQGVNERRLRVDFVNVHSYGGPNADALLKRLEAIRDLYQRPLWITEFLQRYAWFPARPTSIPLGTSALFNEDNTLTPLGEIYRTA
jgi:Glycosyl hydrolase catalytic core/TAT (twin-arginine translocation) pathway signal sequence